MLKAKAKSTQTPRAPTREHPAPLPAGPWLQPCAAPSGDTRTSGTPQVVPARGLHPAPGAPTAAKLGQAWPLPCSNLPAPCSAAREGAQPAPPTPHGGTGTPMGVRSPQKPNLSPQVFFSPSLLGGKDAGPWIATARHRRDLKELPGWGAASPQSNPPRNSSGAGGEGVPFPWKARGSFSSRTS